MAEDMSIFSDVLEPFRKVINTGPPRARLSSVAAKLNFSDQNFSFKTEDISSIAAFGKRKSSIDADGTPDKRKRVDSGSSASPAVSSPWEAKRLKIDLIAAKAQITKLESRINHQHSIQKEMTILFEDEKQSFIDQRRRDEKALADMEERLRLIRKREAETKEELAEALRQISENKIKWDRQKEALQKENAELKDKLIDNNISSNDQMSEMKKDLDELSQALEAAQQEIESLQKEVTVQTARASQCSSLRNQLDKQSTELQEATRKLKELEFEQESYKEWQQQAKSAQKRLAALPELERELVRLQSTERGLRDAAHNKLLLEEQVHSLTARVKALLPAQQQLHQAQVKCATLEASLTEWMELGRARGAAEPRALGAALETAQQKELAATADKIEAESKLAQLREELATAKHEWDKARTKLTDLQHIQKNQESLIHRLQKRLLLVTRERDSYRQQLDCYEKELTVSLTGEGVSGQAGMLSARIQSLEKSLQGYRDLVNKMEQDMAVKSQESSPAMLEQMQRWREEADNLRRENESLRARRDQLETQLEYRALKGDYDPTQTKVLHLSNNPAVAAEKQVQSELEAAQAEIRRLKRRMERLEQEGADASARLSESLRDGAAPQELAQLRQQLESSRIKLQRLKEEFTSSAQEYKDVCYMLLGYKVDRIGHKNYRISSMYAESPEEYLTFTLCDDGIEMVHTEYSASLCDLVELHLHRHHSIPLFLSALTMEQFSRTSEQQEEEEPMVSD